MELIERINDALSNINEHIGVMDSPGVLGVSLKLVAIESVLSDARTYIEATAQQCHSLLTKNGQQEKHINALEEQLAEVEEAAARTDAAEADVRTLQAVNRELRDMLKTVSAAVERLSEIHLRDHKAWEGKTNETYFLPIDDSDLMRSVEKIEREEDNKFV